RVRPRPGPLQPGDGRLALRGRADPRGRRGIAACRAGDGELLDGGGVELSGEVLMTGYSERRAAATDGLRLNDLALPLRPEVPLITCRPLPGALPGTAHPRSPAGLPAGPYSRSLRKPTAPCR